MLYNDDGLLEKVTTTNNGAYQKLLYGPDYVKTFATVNNVADELYAVQYFDGAGRTTLSGGNHPNSTGGYRAQQTIYDQLSRPSKVSNPAEVDSNWNPAGEDAGGWLYTQQTYNWQGKPLVTTNPDYTTRAASYSGCGCAGGEVVTLTDEGTLDGGVAKRRQQKIYSDILGRTVKTEILNWQGGSVYSATVNSYNARDQVTMVRQYAGMEGSSTYQDTIMTYDGHGRLKTRHVPEQNTGAVTTWDYHTDDTIQKITDGRGASQTLGYNARHLPTSITFGAPSGSGITVPSAVAFTYDAAGNRTGMTNGLGRASYARNQLSQITSETRVFTGVGTYSISYLYNLAGSLTSITAPNSRDTSMLATVRH